MDDRRDESAGDAVTDTDTVTDTAPPEDPPAATGGRSTAPEGTAVDLDALGGALIAGRYRVVTVLSSGANTVIVDALDQRAPDPAAHPVTIKVVRPELAARPDFRHKFQVLAELSQALTHPNISSVIDSGSIEVIEDGESQPTVFWVVDAFGGGSLRDLLDRGRTLQPGQALVVGLEACRALDAAHQRGLFHTELTPSKLVFGADRRLRVVDFGMARLLAEDTWTDPANVPTHVARYASPEQAIGLPIDAKTDVYALALVLVEAVTGTVPFAADSTVATLAGRVDRLLPVSADLGALAAILERAARPEAEDRYTAAELGRALVQAAGKLPRPEPIPILSTGMLDSTDPTLRRPTDPTGGVARPETDASTDAESAAAPADADVDTASVPSDVDATSVPSDDDTDDVGAAPIAAAGVVAAAAVAATAGTSTDGPDGPGSTPSEAPTSGDLGGEAAEADDDVPDDEPDDDVPAAEADDDLPAAEADDDVPDCDLPAAEADDDVPAAEPSTGAADDVVPEDSNASAAEREDASADSAPAPEATDATEHAAAADAEPIDGRVGTVPVAPEPQSDDLHFTDDVLASAGTAQMPASVVQPAPASATSTTPVTSDPSVPPLYDEERPRRRIGPIVLVAVILIAGLGALGYAATLLLQPNTFAVPVLAGQPVDRALNQIAGNGWEVGYEFERSDSFPEPEQVIRTVPEPGVELEEGEPFLIVLSEGPEFRLLPEVAELTFDDAAGRLAALGLNATEAAERAFSETLPSGSVVSWQVLGNATLAAGDQILPGETIELTLSAGPEPRIVPVFTDLTLDEAVARADELQLQVVSGDGVFSDDVPEGLVVSQSPADGSSLERGGTITVQLSLGPDVVPLPALDGLTFSEAQEVLTEGGFVIGRLLGTTDGVFVELTIDGEEVEPGTEFRRGTVVDVIFL